MILQGFMVYPLDFKFNYDSIIELNKDNKLYEDRYYNVLDLDDMIVEKISGKQIIELYDKLYFINIEYFNFWNVNSDKAIYTFKTDLMDFLDLLLCNDIKFGDLVLHRNNKVLQIKFTDINTNKVMIFDVYKMSFRNYNIRINFKSVKPYNGFKIYLFDVSLHKNSYIFKFYINNLISKKSILNVRINIKTGVVLCESFKSKLLSEAELAKLVLLEG